MPVFNPAQPPEDHLPRLTEARTLRPEQAVLAEHLGRLVGTSTGNSYRDVCRLQNQLLDGIFDELPALIATLFSQIEQRLRTILLPDTVVPSGLDDDVREEVQAIAAEYRIDRDTVEQWLSCQRESLRIQQFGLPVPEQQRVLQELQGRFERTLRIVLDRFEARFLSTLRRIDQIQQIPAGSTAPELLQDILARLPDTPLVRMRVLEKLPRTAPHLQALYQAGYFQQPPPAEPETGSPAWRWHPLWPESQYLKELAKDHPQQVSDILLRMPLTDNQAVQADLTEAVLVLSAQTAQSWAEREVKWLTIANSPRRLQTNLADRLADLANHLANQGKLELATALYRFLLLFPIPEKSSAEAKENSWSITNENARIEKHEYAKLLKEKLPALRELAAEPTLRLLCDVMQSVLTQAAASAGHANSGDEQDYLTEVCYRIAPKDELPAGEIYDEDENDLGDYDTSDLVTLIDAARAAAETTARIRSVKTAVHALSQHQAPIFRRLILHVLRLYPELDLVKEWLLNRSTFNEESLDPEWMYLLRQEFPKLPAADQNRILGLVEAGPPDLTQRRQRIEEWDGKALTQAQVDQMLQRWKYHKLCRFGNALPASWRQRFERLHAEFQETDSRFSRKGIQTRMRIIPDPPSPKSAAELQAMEIGALIEYLKSWTPENSPRQFSSWNILDRHRSLARELEQAIKREPVCFAEHASKFIWLPRIYIHSFLSAVRDALADNPNLPLAWERLLRFCTELCYPQDSIEDLQTTQPDDLSWFNIYTAIGRLIQQGLVGQGEQSPSIPVAQREWVFELLKRLLIVSKPTPISLDQTKARPVAKANYWITVTLNTPRGIAMSAVVDYGIWLKKSLASTGLTHARPDVTFEQMPELRKLLEEHLDPSGDLDPVLRAVYGMRFWSLCYLDIEWLRAHVMAIFPLDRGQAKPFDAAWTAYLHGGFYPNRDLFPSLRPVYEHAIHSMDEDHEGQDADVKGAYEPLIEHLVGLYAGEDVSYRPGDGDLLDQFFSRASDKLCGSALRKLARRVSRAPNNQDSDEAVHLPQQRARELWQQRASLLLAAPERHRAEAAAFSAWFTSGAFDPAWTLQELEKILPIGDFNRFEPVLCSRLAELASTYPSPCLRCFRIFIDRGGYAATDEARTILVAALVSLDDETEQAAIELIHRLSARGRAEFEDLLPAQSNVETQDPESLASTPGLTMNSSPTDSLLFVPIRQFCVQNFKALADTKIELGTFNVFIGSNGSGKSSILEALGVLSAAVDEKVDARRLKERGVRPGLPALFKTSLKDRRIPLHIKLEVLAHELSYLIALENPVHERKQSWTLSHERLTAFGQDIIGRSPVGFALYGPDGTRILQPKPPAEEAAARLLSQQRPDARAALGLMDSLRNYRIYTPSTPVLRGLEQDDAQEPLGLSGSGLPQAVASLLTDQRLGDFELEEVWELIDWAQQIEVVPVDRAPLSPAVHPSREVLQFTDRFMHERRNQLTGYDASEGALYVLFYLALACHPDAPALCAIDNFDQCLHPRLARRLTQVLATHLVQSGRRQWLVTTHNPLALDGLDLTNDQIRLFTVDRAENGSATVRRITVDPTLLSQEEKGFSLSRLWVMGRLHGIPKYL